MYIRSVFLFSVLGAKLTTEPVSEADHSDAACEINEVCFQAGGRSANSTGKEQLLNAVVESLKVKGAPEPV